MWPKRSKITLAILTLFSLCSHAQQQVLDSVTVMASLQPMQISKTGRNIIVIKGEAFSHLPVHSIDELLRYLPGVEVQQRGPMGSQSDIVLRGGTFQQVLIILDGLRLNDPNTGHFNSYIPIAPAEIHRVEILKGASSAIYGSEAVGGVIQIVTKSFAARKNQSDKKVTAALTGGEYGLWTAEAGVFYQDKSSAFAGGVLSNNSTGQPQRGTRGYFNNTTASVSFSQFLSDDWKISARTAYDKRKFSAQNFYTIFASDTAMEDVTSFWNQVQLVYAKRQDRLTIQGGWKQMQDEYAFNTAAAPNKNKSSLAQGLVFYSREFTEQTTVTTGLQVQDRRIRSNDRGDHNRTQLAAFVTLTQTIGKGFNISPALRVDWDKRAAAEWVPQVNASYRNKSFQFRASAGKTIRQPDFTEGYNNYNKAFVASGSIGNPDLEPERSFSYEAGSDYYISNNFRVSATFFRREQEKVIDWIVTPYSEMPRKNNLSPTGNYALSRNIAKVNTSGIETDIQYNRRINDTQELSGTLGLVWLESKTGEAVPSFYISSHAKFLVTGNLGYTGKVFAVAVAGVYKNREPRQATAINAAISGDYFMVNIKLSVFVWKQYLSAFLETDNVFDKTAQDLLGAQLPGRWTMGGIRFKL